MTFIAPHEYDTVRGETVVIETLFVAPRLYRCRGYPLSFA